MEMETLFSKALGIVDPWYISGVVFDSEKKRLNIGVDFKKGSLFNYKNEEGEVKDYKAYDTVEKTWRHMNFFEHECYLVVRVPRIKPDCGGIKMIFPPFSGACKGFTLLFESFLLQMCRNMPIHQVGKLMKVSDQRLWRLIECYVQKGRFELDMSHLKQLGIDETSRLRGHDYITLFVDLLARKTLHIEEGKGSETISNFAAQLKDNQGVPDQITDVSCDMSPAFIKGVRETFKNAEITFDRFHIMKLVNEALDDVRREEARTQPVLKGARYALLKNDANLTEKQRKQKTHISQYNLKTGEALRMKEAFQALYGADSIEEFESLLTQWHEWASGSKLPPFEKLAKTIEKHWDGIVMWKKSNINNGILEGLNSLIQAAKRKARGYGKKHFETMAYFLTAKLDLHKFNPYLPTGFV